tara:strand:- start:307 stop:1155 length:849 start_codon:yes stop_codon:yes gene_type:complete
MKVKISIIILTLLLSSCAFDTKLFLSDKCNFPINSPYPGGVLGVDIKNKDFDRNKKINIKGLVFSICNYSLYQSKIFIPIPLDFKSKKIEIKQNGSILSSNKIFNKNYRESRITITNNDFVSPGVKLQPRIRREYELSQAAKNTITPIRLKDWAMIEPAKGQMSSEFGVRRFINNQPRNRHGGMDIAATEGTAVIAPLNGEIIIASNFFYKGNVVYINHGAGLVTSYSHLSKIEIKNGDKVKKGDLIGLIGQTGRVTGPHLHWEVYLMGVAINPEIFLATSI